MAKVRIFTTLPVSVIGDDRLHAVDIRVLAAITLHDGMSLSRGTGGGCYAKHKTLAEEVGIDMARFSKSIRRLREFGYVQIEEQSNDRRRKTMRVPYPKDGSRPIAPDLVVTSDNQLVDMVDNETGEIVVKPESEKPANSGLPNSTIYSVKQRIDLAEAKEIDSIEMAHRSDAACNEDDVSSLVNATIGQIGQRTKRKELPTSEINLLDLLPKSFNRMSLDAQLSKLERALTDIDWNDSRLIERHSVWLRNFLGETVEEFLGEEGTTGVRAERMLSRIHEAEDAFAELHNTMNGSAACHA